MPKRSIDDKKLLELNSEGLDQKTIAVRLGCTASGVSRRLKVLAKRNRPLPASFDFLPDKMQRFVLAKAEGKSNTDAAMVSYDCKDRASAKTIGLRLNNSPDIQQAITDVMDSEGIDRRYLVKRLATHVDSNEPNVSLRAVDMGLRLHDSYPATKNINLNINTDIHPVDLSRYL